MGEAMVTSRMSVEKKIAGNRVLSQLGTNASQAINCLYDYLIENKSLPFESSSVPRRHSPEEFAAAAAWVDSLVMPKPADSRYLSMTLKEAKRERLAACGYFDA